MFNCAKTFLFHLSNLVRATHVIWVKGVGSISKKSEEILGLGGRGNPNNTTCLNVMRGEVVSSAPILVLLLMELASW